MAPTVRAPGAPFVSDPSGSAPGASPDATFLTELDERTRLPYSRRLVGGNLVTLDTTTPGQEIINVFALSFVAFVGFGVAQQTTTVVAPPGLITTVDTSYRHLHVPGPIPSPGIPIYVNVSIQCYVAAAQPMTIRLWLNGVGVGTQLDEAFYRSSGSTAPLDTTRITLLGSFIPGTNVAFDLDVSAFYTGGGAAASGLGNTQILVNTLFPIGSG